MFFESKFCWSMFYYFLNFIGVSFSTSKFCLIRFKHVTCHFFVIVCEIYRQFLTENCFYTTFWSTLGILTISNFASAFQLILLTLTLTLAWVNESLALMRVSWHVLAKTLIINSISKEDHQNNVFFLFLPMYCILGLLTGPGQRSLPVSLIFWSPNMTWM